jgi:Transposase DDE domain group 1
LREVERKAGIVRRFAACFDDFREHGLKDTPLAAARCDTIRLRLLKIGAVVRITVRRVWFSLDESYTYQAYFQQAFGNLRDWSPLA